MKNKNKKVLSIGIALFFVCMAFLPGMHTVISDENATNEAVKITIQDNGEEEIYLSYKINSYQTKTINLDGKQYSYYSIQDESHNLMQGHPDLPNIRRSIIIPNDKHMKVEIINQQIDIINNIDIIPSKGAFTRNENPDDIPYTFNEIYEEDTWFPQTLATLDDPYILRDYRGQVIQINPIQYNPYLHQIRIIQTIDIKIYPDGPGEINVLTPSAQDNKIDKDFKELYKHRFLNYDLITNRQRYTPVLEQGNMLVITYDDFYDEMIPFVEWKNMKGIHTEMVNVSTIGDENAIASYIENYYNTQGLTFVLLVGDIGQIPSFISGGNALDPTFGYINGTDSYPELFVGRFSASNTNDLQTQIDRSIEYEKYPQSSASWYHKGCGVASPEGGPGQGDDDEADWEHMRNIRSDLLNFTYTEVDEEYGESQGGEDDPGCPPPDNISADLNDGRSIVNYCGHGSSTTWGWNYPSHTAYRISDIHGLENDNMLPYVVCVACSNGVFNEMDECFCEAWMRATNDVTGEPTGAIVCTGTTKHGMSWAPPMAAQDEMVDLLCNETMLSTGGIHFNGCMLMNDEYGSLGQDETDHWHIFGDPSLQLRTDTPTTMTIDHDNSIMEGSTAFEITVDGVENALCALSHNGNLLNYSYTNAAGETTITFDEPLEDIESVDLVITGFNKMPYIITLDVVPPIRNIAEYEPMQGVLIRYPFGIDYDLIAEMSEDVTVITIVNDTSEQSYVETEYNSHGVNTSNCEYLLAPSDTYWTRDYGPWFRYNDSINEIEVIDFEYNRPRPNDDDIPNQFAIAYGLNSIYMDIIHSGGNYMTDGHGISASTDLVLSENPSMTEEDVQDMFSEYLGIRTYHLYPDPLGAYIEHIDCWGKFLSEDTVMIVEVDESHSHYDDFEDAATYFSNLMSCYGTPYNVVRVYCHLDEPYINSLILNDKVLVPLTGSTYDSDALQAYENAMPGYEVLGFSSTSWIQTDALHCRTKGIPDLDMIDIDHDELIDQMPNDAGFKVETEMLSYGNVKVVLNPTLHWKNTSVGVWNSIPMTNDEDTYTGFIPNHPCGETLSYYFSAENSNADVFKDPFIGSADPYSFDITLVPDIWIDPNSISIWGNEGFMLTENLTIGNDDFAGENLDFTITVSDNQGLGWLSIDVNNGSVAPSSQLNISVMANTTGLNVGIYNENIIINSDDPDTPLITVPVELEIVYAHDLRPIAINKPSEVISPGTYTVNATIENYGSENQTNVLINCSIIEAGAWGTVLEEDFEETFPPAGWTITQYSGSGDWVQVDYTDPYTYSPPGTGSYYAGAIDAINEADYDCGLFTPSMNLIGCNNITLTFARNFQDYGGSGEAAVNIYSGGTDQYHFEEQILFLTDDDPTGGVLTTLNFDPTSYSNPTEVYIEFWYTDEQYSGAWGFAIDDVMVNATSISRDAGDLVYYDTETINHIEYYSSKQIEFTPSWNADPGTYAIKISTLLPGDEDTNNDVLYKGVSVIAADDTGIISINHPTGMQRPGTYTINATVHNFGSANQTTVPVNCSIYDETSTLIYNAEATVDITYLTSTFVEFNPPWTINPDGDYTIIVTTNLANDAQPNNDANQTTITIQAYTDVGANTINNPTGTIPAGLHTINATIENHGARNKTIPVNCTIYTGISYEEDFETDNGGYTHTVGPGPGTEDDWEWGTPTSGPNIAHSGEYCWATNLEGHHSNDSDSVLDSNEINLAMYGSTPELSFWHWYDHTDYDCGNVKISVDDGITWNIIHPETGYTGTASSGNQGIANEPAFTDSSDGWEKVIFNLNGYEGENALLRWHFGSTSSVSHPGWYIDDVCICSNQNRADDITYTAETNIFVEGWQTKTVEFTPPWQANEGNYTIVVTTLLSGDENTSNDSISSAVQVTPSQLTADFTIEPLSPEIGETIYFNSTSTTAEGNIINWTWEMGDNTHHYGEHITHSYNANGSYQVNLTVTNDGGSSAAHSKTVYIGIQEIMDVNQSTFNRGFPIRHATDGDWAGAQDFLPTVDTITSIEIYTRKFGTPEFDLVVELRMDDPEGTLLDTVTIPVETIPSSWTWLTVDFTDVPVTPATPYFIVCPPAPSGVTTSFGYEWGYAFGNQYDDGAFWFTRDGGGLWRDLPTMYEYVFCTYGLV